MGSGPNAMHYDRLHGKQPTFPIFSCTTAIAEIYLICLACFVCRIKSGDPLPPDGTDIRIFLILSTDWESVSKFTQEWYGFVTFKRDIWVHQSWLFEKKLGNLKITNGFQLLEKKANQNAGFELSDNKQQKDASHFDMWHNADKHPYINS